VSTEDLLEEILGEKSGKMNMDLTLMLIVQAY
jgi:hypothetical protein